MGEKKRRKRAAAIRAGLGMKPVLPTVTIRTLSIDFDERTITIDGRVTPVDARFVSLPILTGDAVFVPRGSMERIA